MSRRGLLLGAFLVAGAALLALSWWYDAADERGMGSPQLALDGIDTLATRFPHPDDAPLRWPGDQAVKPGQFAEYWLFGGRVADTTGTIYGFQLAFYRLAVAAAPAERDSAWATQNIYRARLSVEPAGLAGHGEERLSRDALGLAGASSAPSVWLDDWRFTSQDDGATLALEGRAGDVAMVIRLGRPDLGPLPVDGDLYRGYWWPGWQVEGTLEVDGGSIPVRGEAMLDRLWGRALPVGRGQLALARAWLDLGETGVLRCAQLRRREGGGTPMTECVSRPASLAEDIKLVPADDGWRELASGRYPLAWILEGPGSDTRRLTPLSIEGVPSADGWFGVVATGEGGAGWGLLELSNF